MKICIIISSNEWRATAGVRIRYDRLKPKLAAEGHELKLVALGDLNSSSDLDADVCVFSKTHDVRAPILARIFRAQGCRIGIDLFDDYYSQSEDSRFVHLRRWFDRMLPTLDFAMCSTLQMSQRLARLAPGLPCQIVNDPFGHFDMGFVGRRVAHNAAKARMEKHLRIGWFGIGDNPYFSLGLEDLFAFSDRLLGARRLGYTVELNILTNARAFTAERMEMLARLPVPFRLEEWSEKREAALVADSLACFLPVNAQPFSIVKSLNRGISTLTGGSQILSTGFPLYDLLDDFVYQDIDTMIEDLESDRLRLSERTTVSLSKLMESYGRADIEARALVDFLDRIPAPAPHDWPPDNRTVMMLHGLIPVGDIHKAAPKLGVLSVAAPQTRRVLNYDVALLPDDGQGDVELLLSSRGWAALRTEFRATARPNADVNTSHKTYTLRLPRSALENAAPIKPLELPKRPLAEMVRYRAEIQRMHQLLKRLYPTPIIFHSEAHSPYWEGYPFKDAVQGDAVSENSIAPV